MKRHALFLLPLLALGLAAAPEPAEYQPDLSRSDIYLPHLKRLPLSGWWKLNKVSADRKNDPADAGTRAGFQQAAFDDSGWERDLVPNEIHVPFLLPKDARGTGWNARFQHIPKAVREWGGVAWYRRGFTAPAMKKGERAVLFFNEVAGDFTVWVNGKEIGRGVPYTPPVEYCGPQNAYEFDVTEAIRPGGENQVAVRLFHNGDPVRWGWAGKMGILDLVYLDIRPAAYTANVLVTTRPNLRDVFFECILSGSQGEADTTGWKGEIFEWNSGKIAAKVEFGKPYEEDGLRLVSGTGKPENPKLWSWESPFLYGLRVKNARGEVTGVQRFGMRTFGVKDGNFVLNGQPVMLRGLTYGHDFFPLQTHGWLYALRTNTAEAFRKFWTITAKDANVNHIRMHSSTLARNQYDLLDEFGIIITDELDYPATRIENPVRADQIDVKGFDGACDENGKLRPEFIAKVKARIRRSYSHPSLCTYSFGNEIRQYDDLRVEKLLNNLYDLYHAVDKQQRPTTNSSGRFWKDGSNVKEMATREKFDYIDTHDYTGSINNFPVAYCEPVVKHFHEVLRKQYGATPPPVVNGEVVYMANHYHSNVMDPIWKNESDPQPDWDKMLYMLNDWRKERPHESFLGHYWIRNWGAKNYKFHRELGRGLYNERILEVQRKCWPDQDGYENLTGSTFTTPAAYPFEAIEFVPNQAYPYLARVNSPVIAVLDYLAPNRFVNEELTTRLHAVNNRETAVEKVVFEALFEQNGKEASRTSLEVGRLASNETKILPFAWKTPAAPGVYQLTYRLVSGGKVLNERDLRFSIRDRKELFRPVASAKRIALYDASAAFGKLKPNRTAALLKAFGLSFETLTGFDNCDKFDIIVIGRDSIDGRVQAGATQIRSFVEKGGRLLVLDQNHSGRIPFLPELEYVLAGPGQFSEILRFDHPALAGLDQWDFFCWNQKDWSVYRTYIAPASRAALLIGGDTTQWGSDYFGMVAAHLKLGKGDVLLSQAEIPGAFADDSGAALFGRRLLETIVDDNTRKNASEFTGLPVLRVPPLTEAKAACITLKGTANMAFADEVAGDGKGGWSDQGALNDLAPFPVGKRFFNGVPFNIVDPKENGGVSCIVVSDNPKLKFQPESKPIAVNAKVKRLLFLHAGAWMDDRNPAECGAYKVDFASGRSLSIPLRSGENIGDWWSAPTKKFPNADCAWSAMNRSGVVGVYLTEWINPAPTEEIRSVTVQAKNHAMIGLVGLTAETTGGK